MIVQSKAIVLVVISFLVVILIYSSVTEVDIFAKPKISYQCFKITTTSPFYSEVCCQFISGNPVQCSRCWYDADGNAVGSSCESWTPKTGQPVMGNSTAPAGTLLPPSGNNTGGITNGQTGLPGRLGTLLPPGNNTGGTAGGTKNGQTGMPCSLGTALPLSGNNTGGMTNGQKGPTTRLTIPPPPGICPPGKTTIFHPIRNTTNALPGNSGTSTPPPGSIIKVPPGTTSAFPGNNSNGTLPTLTTTKEHNPASPNILSLAGNATNSSTNTGTPLTGQTQQTTGGHHHHKGGTTSSSSNTNSTGH